MNERLGSSKFSLLLHVRQGFERDAAAELAHYLEQIGVEAHHLEAQQSLPPDTGIAKVEFLDRHAWSLAQQKLQFRSLIFARQLLWMVDAVDLPDDGDRVAGLVESIAKRLLPEIGHNAFSAFIFETPDTDRAKELSSFCKALTRPLERHLNGLKLLPKGKGASHLPRLHLMMMSHRLVYVAYSVVGNSSPWPQGIPRLKFPSGAPSRSTLKLDEAFQVLLTDGERADLLTANQKAVDLGASPGGWTFQFVKRGIQTTAVDNGSMDKALMSSGLVLHLEEDAFTFRPTETVDWMVCDVVDQPFKIAKLMVHWLTHGYCRQTIFNLKLPMKKCFEEVQRCLSYIQVECEAAGLTIEIRAKQLYHDRKEVTVFLRN